MPTISDAEIEIVLLSLEIAGLAMLVTMPIALFLGWLLARYEFTGKNFVNGIIHLPLVIPPVVVGYVLLIMLGRRGIVGEWLYDQFGLQLAFTWRGAAIAAGVMALPLMVRAIRLGFEAVDQKLEIAARTLGASKLRVITTITLPLSAPGIISALILGFARALGEFGATITFVSNIPGETQTLPLAIYGLNQTPGEETAVLRLTVLAVIIALVAVFASEWLAKRSISRHMAQRGV